MRYRITTQFVKRDAISRGGNEWFYRHTDEKGQEFKSDYPYELHTLFVVEYNQKQRGRWIDRYILKITKAKGRVPNRAIPEGELTLGI